VLADGEVVTSKSRGLLARLFGGWPDPAEVVVLLHKRSLAKGG